MKIIRLYLSGLILSSFLLGAAGGMGVIALASTPELELNNIAVKQIVDKKFFEAIRTLEACLKLNPNYAMARDNLAIAHNNLGLELYKTDPKAAFGELTKSYYFNSSVLSTKQNIDKVAGVLAGKSASGAVYMKLADDALIDNDLISAYVDLDLAAKLDHSLDNKVRMLAIDERIKTMIKDGKISGVGTAALNAGAHPDAARPEPSASVNALQNADYSPELRDYVMAIEPKIKDAWLPPKDHKAPFDISRKTVCQFQVTTDGAIVSPIVSQSSGSDAADQLALAALKRVGPLGRLPAEQTSAIPIQFTFAFNVHNHKNGGGHASVKTGDAPPVSLTFTFDRQNYVNRWSKSGQNEFTPTSEKDLNKWNDMMTVSIFKHLTNLQGVKAASVATQGLYKSAGVLLDTTNRKKADQSEDYLLVGLIEDPNKAYTEIAFTRFMLVKGHGQSIVYSHRIYHSGPDKAVVDSWLATHKATMTDQLANWSDWPGEIALSKLPESKDDAVQEIVTH